MLRLGSSKTAPDVRAGSSLTDGRLRNVDADVAGTRRGAQPLCADRVRLLRLSRDIAADNERTWRSNRRRPLAFAHARVLPFPLEIAMQRGLQLRRALAPPELAHRRAAAEQFRHGHEIEAAF